MHRRDESYQSEAQPLASDIQSVALVSLGCPKNLVDSERMLGLLAGDGLAVAADAADADAIVINTCGFLAASREEALEEIRQAVRLKTSGRCKRVIVAGCLVQRDKLKLLREAPGWSACSIASTSSKRYAARKTPPPNTAISLASTMIYRDNSNTK